MDAVPVTRFATSKPRPRHVGEEYLNARPFTIGFAMVLAMVALRVTIGWHFFQQGLAHKNNPTWAGEVDLFVHQAKGPLADTFKQHLAIFHDMDRLLLVPLTTENKKDDSVAAG